MIRPLAKRTEGRVHSSEVRGSGASPIRQTLNPPSRKAAAWQALNRPKDGSAVADAQLSMAQELNQTLSHAASGKLRAGFTIGELAGCVTSNAQVENFCVRFVWISDGYKDRGRQKRNTAQLAAPFSDFQSLIVSALDPPRSWRGPLPTCRPSSQTRASILREPVRSFRLCPGSRRHSCRSEWQYSRCIPGLWD
jgi:hypothetical protein